MIQVIGQATQSNGGSPSWTLTGICKSAARTADGTYTVTIDYLGTLGIDSKDKLTILISAERGNLGTERYVVDWTSANTFRIRNYTARNNQTLGDCMLTITILADVNLLRLGFSGNTLIFPKYKFFDITSDGGYIEASNTAGYPGELNVLTGVPASDVYKFSGFNITGASLTGNEFKYGNNNVSAEALFEHSRDLTLINSEHGTLSADKMSGFSGDIVTVDATTDEGWYFTGLNVTGATATGNQFTFVGNDVTAEGLYTDQGFPITYESDEHVSITGDNIYIPGGTGITLQTGYDTYYRISGYEVTGGTVENGVLIANGPCTARVVSEVNTFTATGTFNFGTLSCRWNGQAGSPSRTSSKVGNAIVNSFTGRRPANWPANGAAWNVTNASSYSVKTHTVWSLQNVQKGRFASTGSVQIAGSNKVTVTGDWSKNYTTRTQDCNLSWNSTQGKLAVYGKISANTMNNEYRMWLSTNAWTATGYAP